MRAWLIYDREGAVRNADYIQMHFQLAEEFGVDLQLIIDVDVPNLLAKKIMPFPDFCFVRTIAPSLSLELEKNGILVFNSAMVSKICNDKGKTIAYVEKHTDVPVVPTKRFQRQQLSETLLAGYKDSVIKAVAGHGGKQVFRTTEKFEMIQQGIGQDDFIIQPFIHGQGKDIRIYIIGDRIMGAVERTSTNGFRSNFSLGGKVLPYSLSEKEISQVRKIISCFSFGMVGIDFIVDKAGNLLLNEIEDVVGARMYYQCYPNRNLLRDYFSYVVSTIV